MNRVSKNDHFYDKAYDWLIERGPAVLLGIVLLLAGLWLINWFNGWLRRRFVEKRCQSIPCTLYP